MVRNYDGFLITERDSLISGWDSGGDDYFNSFHRMLIQTNAVTFKEVFYKKVMPHECVVNIRGVV